MPIPSYQELMLPMLRVLDKTGPIHTRDCAKLVGDQLGIPEEDQEELLPSGTQTLLLNRTGWLRAQRNDVGTPRQARANHGRADQRTPRNSRDAVRSAP